MSKKKYKTFTIGLTGGIGSGKSLVGSYFAELLVPVIDADDVAREVVARGQPALTAMAQHFGRKVINNSGELDRKLLRKIIFDDETERAWVESLLHPLIREKIISWINQQDTVYCIVVIPLLIEKSNYPFIDRILVIDVPEELQIQRVRDRDQVSKEEILKIINTQVSREYRLANADDILLNDISTNQLKEKVIKLNDFYRQKFQQECKKG